MTFETAKRIIDYEMNLDDEYDSILFDFMGGEPFVEFELIKKICNYLWSNNWKKKFMFFASTNGTLVHGHIQEWLRIHYKDFVCGLSLDGSREVHNKNRSNSFDLIDIGFFVSTWPLQHVKMTISPDTLPFLAEGVTFLHNLGFKVKSNLAYGPDWSGLEVLQTYNKQLSYLISFYTQFPDIEPTTIVNMDLSSVAYPKQKLHKWCGMGEQMIAYDIKGVKFPCHFFQDMSSPNMHCDKIWDIDFSSIQNECTNECRKCILKNSCPTCYGYNYSRFNDFCKKDENMCKLKKLSAIASSTLSYRKLIHDKNNDFSSLSLKEKEIIMAAWTIQRAVERDCWDVD